MIAQPSVMSLKIEMLVNGNKLADGTGFLVTDIWHRHYLITNRHNLTGRWQDTGQPLSPTGGIPDTVRILHLTGYPPVADSFRWNYFSEPLYVGELPVWVEHPVLGARADFVALRLSNMGGAVPIPYDLPPYASPMPTGPADRISVVGFPFGLASAGAFAIWATGFMASDPDVNFDGLPLQLIDCRTRPGQSGSPVIIYHSGAGAMPTAQGMSFTMGPRFQLLGVYSGRINAESDIGRVWKASAIAELIAEINSRGPEA